MEINLFELDSISIHPLISDLHWGFRASRVLHVANNLDIFTRLDAAAMTADEIAEQCGTNPTMTEKLRCLT
ncbi:hypothetical protein HYR99_12350 [Candidatus Poribacteria bacterium]|nr:hypothetical protein [Candidatus Poribacteria bacterium]